MKTITELLKKSNSRIQGYKTSLIITDDGEYWVFDTDYDVLYWGMFEEKAVNVFVENESKQ